MLGFTSNGRSSDRYDLIVPMPAELAAATEAAMSRVAAAGGSVAVRMDVDVYETMWTPKMPGVRRTCIEYTPMLKIETNERSRHMRIVYFDSRTGHRFVHPDAIARATAWVLGETDVDTDDPRSDAEIAAGGGED